MNFIHLKYAIEVERTGSITKAAENLYMNQPHLSKAIRELEDTAGITIFSRTSKGVIPTKKGKEFLVRAKSILLQIDDMKALGHPKDPNKVNIDISSVSTSYLSYALAKFSELLASENEIHINCLEHNITDVIESISNFGSDLGIIRVPIEHKKYHIGVLESKGLEFDTIAKFPRVAIMSSASPLSNFKDIDKTQLSDSIRISDNNLPTSPKERNEKHIIKLSERESRFEILSHNFSAYMITCPLNEELLKRYSLVQKQYLTDKATIYDYLIYRKGYNLSLWENRFIEVLKDEAQKAAIT